MTNSHAAAQDLYMALAKTLLDCEPELGNGNDDAVKRTTFVLSRLLGLVLADVRDRHGEQVFDAIFALNIRQIAAASKEDDLAQVIQ
jgi:hypothetical protein